jgi:diadenylate cyclase
VDVLLVSIIIYYTLALIRGTRAMQISIGLLLLTSTFFIAREFELATLEVISAQILFYLPFAVIVLFQQEIRRALARMAANPLAVLFRPRAIEVRSGAIVDASRILSARRVGALIVMEGRQSLRPYEENAKPVDGALTADLIGAIFTPGGPLHDGAAIIRGDRVSSANAFLPLTTSTDSPLAHGTRHRAALGLSEETDSLIVVVSEENGSIAVAHEGTLHENLDAEQLRRLLLDFGAGR